MSTVKNTPEWGTVDEVGARYGVSGRTVRRYVAQGQLRAKKFGPRLIRVRYADFEALGDDVPTVEST